MREALICFVFFATSLISCTKELRFNPPFEGEKLVINGQINKNGVFINLSHSVNPVRDCLPNEDLGVPDAIMSLFENGLFICNLEHTGEGNYVVPSNLSFVPEEGKHYKVKAPSVKYPEAVSDDVIIPTLPEIKVLSYRDAGIHYAIQSGLHRFNTGDFT